MHWYASLCGKPVQGREKRCLGISILGARATTRVAQMRDEPCPGRVVTRPGREKSIKVVVSALQMATPGVARLWLVARHVARFDTCHEGGRYTQEGEEN